VTKKLNYPKDFINIVVSYIEIENDIWIEYLYHRHVTHTLMCIIYS